MTDRTLQEAMGMNDQETAELRERAERLSCGCPGLDVPNVQPCRSPATQEDFLCDHCRAVQCPDRTPAELGDYTLCHRLGCPEHSVPGSQPVAAF